jgi:TolB protein
MLSFGKTEIINSNLVITARLFDLGNPTSPSIIAKRYVATLNEISTREAAHRYANEIIQTLGGGVPGIYLTKIAFVSRRTGHAEIWVMDYDGSNQHPITSYGSLSTTPRWAPDNAKLAFTSYASGNPEIYIFSLETNQRVPFPSYKGLNTTPAWSPDGKKIAFCSSMSGDPEIYVSDVNGFNLQRLTFSPGVDISPAWNPKTGSEMAFVSDRSGTRFTSCRRTVPTCDASPPREGAAMPAAPPGLPTVCFSLFIGGSLKPGPTTSTLWKSPREESSS